jgi:uncharacterized protein (DUF1697 family)
MSMASVVFLRGVNVGGNRTFQPSLLSRALAHWDVINVGAAGTFVIRKPIGEAAVRAGFLAKLPFETHLTICRGRDLLDLAAAKPFSSTPAGNDTRPFVSVLAKRPRTLPHLPISQPPGEKWQVRIVGISGKLVLSLMRRLGKTMLYPNEVVEKHFGTPATTRNWGTIVTLCEILKAG